MHYSIFQTKNIFNFDSKDKYDFNYFSLVDVWLIFKTRRSLFETFTYNCQHDFAFNATYKCECPSLQSGDEYILPMSSDASLTFAQ